MRLREGRKTERVEGNEMKGAREDRRESIETLLQNVCRWGESVEICLAFRRELVPI